jgi:DNA-binding NarL/FixJ family response regulator
VSEISILLVGSTRRSEFRQARAALDNQGRVVAVANVEAAAEAMAAGGLAPDLIIVAQSFPGQFSSASIDRLRRLAPLARLLGLLGTWCEGETRTGQPWPAAIRIYWHEWQSRVEQEIARLREGTCSTWALPITASEEERLLLLADEPLAGREGLIAVWTPHFDMQDWLRAACKRRGYETVWIEPHRPMPTLNATAAIFDGNECRGREAQSLRRLADALGPVPIIALLEFPRVDDHTRALAAGARAVLSKPLLIEDLFWQIDQLVDAPPHAP